MRRFIDFKIITKLVIGFLTISIIGTIIGTVGLVSVYELSNEDKRMYEQNTLALQYAGSAATTFVLIRYNTYKLSVLTDPAALQPIVDNNTVLKKNLEDYLLRCDKAVIKPEFNATLDKLKDEWENTYLPGMEKVTSLVMAGNSKDAKALIPDLAKLGTSMYNDLIAFLAVLSEDSAKMSQSNTSIALRGFITMMIIMVVGVISSVIIAIYIARIISKPLVKAVDIANQLSVGNVIDCDDIQQSNRQDEIGRLQDSFYHLMISTQKQVEIAQLISEGDLTSTIDLRSEHDSLGKGFQQLSKGLRELVYSIDSASGQVAEGASMLSNSSLELSQGATAQASAVEELTASIEEIARQTSINTRNAQEAKRFADNSKTNAALGTEQMQSMLEAMDKISQSTNNISRIIKVIDDIAFQTNLLALNAAVEAARAGQHGKGFAVVAEEVRKLAAKSVAAVKETTELVTSSIKSVDDGTKTATKTASFLNLIVSDIEKAAALNTQIAQSSIEQASGINQVNQGIIQVSRVVQTNVSTAEESAAASQQLSSQAEHLRETVNVFKLPQVQFSAQAQSYISIN